MPLKPCVQPNEEKQMEFGGSQIEGKGREVHFLASINRFSEFSTLKLYNNANADIVEKSF